MCCMYFVYVQTDVFMLGNSHKYTYNAIATSYIGVDMHK